MLSQRAEARPQSMQSIADALAEWTNHSDLVTRVKEATKIREQQPTGDHSSSPASRNASLALPTVSPAVVVPPRRNRWMAIVATGFFGIAMALSMVITLQMTSGQLVIETSSPDVKVQILKAGQPHRQLTLNQTANSLRLGAGEYDIEIISEADGLRIENGRFTLNRGETWLAKIVHEEGAPAAEVTRAEEPTYDGRTLDQWIALLLQDRSPKQFVDATRALEKLAIGPREDDAIMAVLTAMRFHSWDAKHIDEKGNSLSLSQSVVSFLNGRDPKVVTNALSRELDLRKEANIDLIVKVLIPSNQDLRPHFEERLQGQIIQLADDDAPGRRIDALNALYFVSGRDRVIERLTDALDDTDPRVQLYAAEKLIGIKANIDQVVSTLRTLLQAGELEHRANAAWFLGDIGAAAEPALPELIEIVQQDDESDISRAAVYRNARNGGVSKVSVKGAAIHAIAEIGNQSALPVLTELWIARETGNNSPTNQGRRPGSSLVSHLVNAEHVEQAIEQLTGMRPVWNDEAGKIVWKAEGLFFSQAFKTVFESKLNPSIDFVGLATRLLPHTSEFERKQAIGSIGVLQVPSASQLSLQLEMIDLLAKHDDAHAVLMAIFNRIDLLRNSLDGKTVPLDDVVAAYLDSAFQIWVTLEPSLKSESLVSPLSTIGRSSEAIQGMPDTLICEWLSSPEHLKSFYDRILKINPPYWYLAIFGLSQLGLANDETFELLTSRFSQESLDRTVQERPDPKRLLLAFVYTLHWQPELTQRLIDLLEDPRMDVAYVRFLHEDRVEEKVSLRGAILANLQDVPADLRKAFVPMLRQLVESGTRTEANVAKSLLDIWEM